jgi:Zn-dependent protease
MEQYIDYLYIIPAALIAIMCHELTHGLFSHLQGDPTPKEQGRLSLNPAKHLDLFGTLCLIFLGFGWAKPVQVDPRYYKNPKWGMALVALGGPLANFVIAFLSGLILTLIEFYVPYSDFSMILYNFFLYLIIINVGLGLFNLIPIPPLDGSKIIGAILPENSYHQYMKYQKYGMFFIIGLLILLDVLEMMGYPSILNEALNVIVNFILNFWMKIFI